MDMLCKEWELAGFVIFKDERNTVGVLVDPASGSHWDKFYIRRKEFWLDVREAKLSYVAKEIHDLCASKGITKRLVGMQLCRKWGTVVGAKLEPHSYESMEKLAENVASSRTREEIERRVGAVYQEAANSAYNKYNTSLSRK